LSSADPPRDKVAARARELEHGGEGHEGLDGDPESAARASQRMLEESEARTHDPATTDPESDDVLRRSSDETT
jgi:hypothetical protein